MIRFIDLRNQNTGYNFAYFDTVTNRFIEINGECVWNTFEEFLADYKVSSTQFCHANRFKRITPGWAFAANHPGFLLPTD